eukprot:scaffold3550_cov112-Isochrysis_galbana.AAC.5
MHMTTRQGRHKGAGKGAYTLCSEGGGSARGGLPTPLSFGFRGREVSCEHIQAMWGQLGPTIQLIFPHQAPQAPAPRTTAVQRSGPVSTFKII